MVRLTLWGREVVTHSFLNEFVDCCLVFDCLKIRTAPTGEKQWKVLQATNLMQSSSSAQSLTWLDKTTNSYQCSNRAYGEFHVFATFVLTTFCRSFDWSKKVSDIWIDCQPCWTFSPKWLFPEKHAGVADNGILLGTYHTCFCLLIPTRIYSPWKGGWLRYKYEVPLQEG